METVDTAAQVVAPEAGQESAAQETESAQIEKLRKESARYRTEAKDLAAKVAGFEAERQTEGERLAAQAKAAQEAAAKAQAQLREARADAAIARVAAKEQVSPELLSKLVTVDFDDDGNPVNVEAAVAKAISDYPQIKPLPVTPGATNPGRANGTKLTIKDIERMTPDEINARWSDVQAAMKAARG